MYRIKNPFFVTSHDQLMQHGMSSNRNSKRWDVIAIAENAGLRPQLSGTGLAIARCPFHEDGRPSLMLGERANMWRCMAGCFGGTWHKGIELARELGIDMSSNYERSYTCKSVKAIPTTDNAEKINRSVKAVLRVYLRYLDSRQVTGIEVSQGARAWIRAHGTGMSKHLYVLGTQSIRWLYDSISPSQLSEVGFGTEQKRLVIPGERDVLLAYRDQNGEPLTAQAVATSATQRQRAKYLNLRGRQYLFGLDRWRGGELKDAKRVVLTEGVADCLSLRSARPSVRSRLFGTDDFWTIGIPSANTFRKSWAQYFLDKNVIVCFDHDDAGQTGANHVVELLTDAGVNARSKVIGKEGDDLSSWLSHLS